MIGDISNSLLNLSSSLVELGKNVLLRFANAVNEIAEIEQQPKLEGRYMNMILMPKKEK